MKNWNSILGTFKTKLNTKCTSDFKIKETNLFIEILLCLNAFIKARLWKKKFQKPTTNQLVIDIVMPTWELIQNKLILVSYVLIFTETVEFTNTHRKKFSKF